MKLIKPGFAIIKQEPGLDGMYKQIELAGRTCYKSEDRITIDSAKGFVERMVKSGHGAMLEHGTVYLYIPYDANQEGNSYVWDDQTDRHYDTYVLKYQNNAHTRVHYDEDFNAYITTNYRVLVENDWLRDLEYMCEPKSYHEHRYTVKFTCDRGVTHEFVRHRVFSFAQESTRYCNYSKDKFGSEVTFILPPWLDENNPNLYKCWQAADNWGECLPEYYYRITDIGAKDGMYVDTHQAFATALFHAEKLYFSLLENGWKAQEARAVLPNAVKAELVMTGFASDWKHFFDLRDAASAHPQARELAEPLHKEFINRQYI
jgi:thymidylate synthase (FAD)